MADSTGTSNPFNTPNQRSTPASKLHYGGDQATTRKNMAQPRFREFIDLPGGGSQLGPASTTRVNLERDDYFPEEKVTTKKQSGSTNNAQAPCPPHETPPRLNTADSGCSTPSLLSRLESYDARQRRRTSLSTEGSPRARYAHEFMESDPSWGVTTETNAKAVIELIKNPGSYENQKPGKIYALYDPELQLVKIGQTTKTGAERLKELGYASKCNIKGGHELKGLDDISINDIERLEALIHADLAPHRWFYRCRCGKRTKQEYTRHREWFEVPDEHVIKTIQFWTNFVRREPWIIPTSNTDLQLKPEWHDLLKADDVKYEETHNDYEMRLNRWRKMLKIDYDEGEQANDGVTTETTTKIKEEFEVESAMDPIPPHHQSTPTIAVKAPSEADEYFTSQPPSPSPKPGIEFTFRSNKARSRGYRSKGEHEKMAKPRSSSKGAALSQTNVLNEGPHASKFTSGTNVSHSTDPNSQDTATLNTANSSTSLAKNVFNPSTGFNGPKPPLMSSSGEDSQATSVSQYEAKDEKTTRESTPVIASRAASSDIQRPIAHTAKSFPSLGEDVKPLSTTANKDFEDSSLSFDTVLSLVDTFSAKEAGALPPRTIAADLQQLTWPLACSIVLAILSSHMPALLSFAVWSIFLPFFVAEMRNWNLLGGGSKS